MVTLLSVCVETSSAIFSTVEWSIHEYKYILSAKDTQKMLFWGEKLALPRSKRVTEIEKLVAVPDSVWYDQAHV